MPRLNLKPTHKPVEEYYKALTQLKVLRVTYAEGGGGRAPWTETAQRAFSARFVYVRGAARADYAMGAASEPVVKL